MFINNLCYEASAGSGKTFMLVVRYLSLLFRGAHPERILALTFTNKAANEMQERIVLTLEELDNRGELQEIVNVSELSKEYILENRQKVLQQFLNSNTKIMTIDKFFTQILRKFSLYASLMPDFTTSSSQHEIKLLSRFLKEVSVANKTKTLIHLSLESSKRLETLFSLLEEFYIKQKELKHIKFEKQNMEMYEQESLKYLAQLREIVEACPQASASVKKAVDAQDFKELLKKAWIGRESLNYRTFSKCYTPTMDLILHNIQTSLKAYFRAKEQNFFYALSELVQIYKKSKEALFKDDSELSFNDVTLLVYYLLKERVDSEFLYFRLDATIEHILLDEFQDTSILQYEILKPLIDEILSGTGVSEDGSFFFVGDVKQSIYRFRGGVSALFESVKQECGTRGEQLVVNYRSQAKVIEFVNNVFLDKIKNYTPQKVRESADGGYVEVLEDDEILEATLTQVKKLQNLGANINDIAILCATNGDGEEIKSLLQEHTIEVVTETTTKLINQQSVQAVLEYLKYQYFKEDIYKYNFFTLIQKQPCDIAFVDMSRYSLIELIKNAIERYNLFHEQFHLIRFLHVVSQYDDIEALLFEYERLDVSSASSDLNGVRVLTVHKSKGLEYEHVIVMDRLKKAPAARDSIIYEYNGIELHNIYLRTKGREEIDSDYSRALSKEQQLLREDALNALYVAFTRAKENLFVIAKSKNSMFEILDLKPMDMGLLKEITNQVDLSQHYEKLYYQELSYGTQSDILSVDEEEEENLKAINFGIALHYMLEMLGEFTSEYIQDAKNMMLNRYGFLLDDEEVEDISNRVQMLVTDKEFLSFVENGICFREKALKYKNNLRYIDLLVQRDDGGYVVIDYKSADGYLEHYKEQVGNYITYVKEITSCEVEGYICYLLKDGVKLLKVE